MFSTLNFKRKFPTPLSYNKIYTMLFCDKNAISSDKRHMKTKKCQIRKKIKQEQCLLDMQISKISNCLFVLMLVLLGSDDNV